MYTFVLFRFFFFLFFLIIIQILINTDQCLTHIKVEYVDRANSIFIFKRKRFSPHSSTRHRGPQNFKWKCSLVIPPWIDIERIYKIIFYSTWASNSCIGASLICMRCLGVSSLIYELRTEVIFFYNKKVKKNFFFGGIFWEILLLIKLNGHSYNQPPKYDTSHFIYLDTTHMSRHILINLIYHISTHKVI